MKLIKFDNYDEYKTAQVAANELKFSHVFAERGELERIAADFAASVPAAGNGLCHGVRNGYEVQVLRSLLPGLDLLGTDISDTAKSVPNCIVWDMHEVKPEWLGKIDFMYSNSWDHCYDPKVLFERWAACLSYHGRLYLPYTELHSERGVTESSKYDAFGCSLDELIEILRRTLVVEGVLEIAPRATAKLWKRRLRYLTMGKFAKLKTVPRTSRHITVLVLRRRVTAVSA